MTTDEKKDTRVDGERRAAGPTGSTAASNEAAPATSYSLPWPLRGAAGICFDIDGYWWHEPGSCEFCAEER